MNKTILVIGGIAIVGVLALVLFTSGSKTPTPVTTNNQNTPAEVTTNNNQVDSDGDSLPDNAEVLLGTDPQNPDTDGDGLPDGADPKPVFADAPAFVSNISGADDYKIKSVLVENNVDAGTGKAATDHLEIFLESISKTDITNLSLYYTITDLVTNDTQSYIIPLTDYVLKAGVTESIHIDTSGETGHFRANPNSLYFKSQNERQVTVSIASPGHKTQTETIKKDKGGAELAD